MKNKAPFEAPSYHTMRNDMLDKCCNQVKEHVQNVILNNISFSSYTIVSDGWSNAHRRPFINIMHVSNRGETFVQAIDSNGCIKYGLYIVDLISIVIDNVSANNVVQIIMDNAKNFKAASRILK